MRLNLAIIHFSPLEQYPPVMNWLEFLAKRLTDKDRVMVLTRNPPAGMETFKTPSPLINIKRYPAGGGGTALSRYRSYLGFYVSAIRQLAREKPDTVLYYESLSAVPGLYYKYFLRRNTRLLVHYHEYTTPVEYRNSMLINYRSHLLEKRLYPLFSGISHTNPGRLGLFQRDNQGIRLPPQTIWPNYPPQHWLRSEQKPEAGSPVRFVYVGALNMETMYVHAFATWVVAQRGAASWDIYSWNCTPETRRYIAELRNNSIRFHDGVSYSSLPDILNGFDVGVILYKGHIPNYIYNAPNKLFEYWSCGLDVWFPVQMTGAIPFITNGTYPRILAVDFETPGSLSLSSSSHTGLAFRPSTFTSESAGEQFFNEMTQCG